MTSFSSSSPAAPNAAAAIQRQRRTLATAAFVLPATTRTAGEDRTGSDFTSFAASLEEDVEQEEEKGKEKMEKTWQDDLEELLVRLCC